MLSRRRVMMHRRRHSRMLIAGIYNAVRILSGRLRLDHSPGGTLALSCRRARRLGPSNVRLRQLHRNVMSGRARRGVSPHLQLGSSARKVRPATIVRIESGWHSGAAASLARDVAVIGRSPDC
jgi:hypothetical protein